MLELRDLGLDQSVAIVLVADQMADVAPDQEGNDRGEHAGHRKQAEERNLVLLALGFPVGK